MNKQSGFTLIELVMVIVILGILAATALPKFVDLSGSAKIAAVQGYAGGLGSAGTINYANRSLNGSGVGTSTNNVACSTALVTALMQGTPPANYTFTGTASTVSLACTVADSSYAAASATVNIPAI